jgi:hypothetical protein
VLSLMISPTEMPAEKESERKRVRDREIARVCVGGWAIRAQEKVNRKESMF